jgi:hypothetical protein
LHIRKAAEFAQIAYRADEATIRTAGARRHQATRRSQLKASA